MKEGARSERSERREGLSREEYVTDEYTPAEATMQFPGKRELPDEDLGDVGTVAELASLSGVGPSTAHALVEAGFPTVRTLADADAHDVAARLHVGSEVAAAWIREAQRAP